MSISFGKLVYSSQNLGDDIQTLATIPFIGEDAIPFDRDSLANHLSDKKYMLIMNGWWADQPATAFPPAACFIPVFIGFHIAKKYEAYFTSPECIEYFKRNQPIGCRDEYTMELLKAYGIDAFFSGCLTTTFPKREPLNKQGVVCLVDTQTVNYIIPAEIKHHAIHLSHDFQGHPEDRATALINLMHKYEHEVSMVITTRLHAALTCSSMGIPVVLFFDKNDPRASTAKQIGLRMHRPRPPIPKLLKKILKTTKTLGWWARMENMVMHTYYALFEKINWHPIPLEFEEHKRKLTQQTRDMIYQRNQ